MGEQRVREGLPFLGEGVGVEDDGAGGSAGETDGGGEDGQGGEGLDDQGVDVEGAEEGGYGSGCLFAYPKRDNVGDRVVLSGEGEVWARYEGYGASKIGSVDLVSRG